MVRFQSAVAGDVLMLDGPATQLLEMMGYPASRKGAVMAEDIADVRQKLVAALAAAKAAMPAQPADEAATEDAPEPGVSLSQRAWPLLEMLRLAAERQQHVSWGL